MKQNINYIASFPNNYCQQILKLTWHNSEIFSKGKCQLIHFDKR